MAGKEETTTGSARGLLTYPRVTRSVIIERLVVMRHSELFVTAVKEAGVLRAWVVCDD